MTALPTDTVGVLVVDDQDRFRRAATALVSRMRGFGPVVEAATGEEAVEVAAQETPGLVLMDINLPGINGIEATRRIVAASSDGTPVVVLVSTYPIDDLPADARTCGARGYLRKEDLSPVALRGLWARGADEPFVAGPPA